MIWLVARRAAIEIFRDRKTVLGFVMMPVLAVLLLTVLRGEIEEEIADQSQISHRVAVQGIDHATDLTDFLRANGLLVVRVDDARATVSAREQPVGLIIPTGAQDAIAAGRSADLQVVTGERSIRGQFAQNALQGALARYADQLVARRLAAAGLPDATASPLQIREIDARPERQRQGSALADLLPFLVLAQILGLGQGIASETTTSQRERRTLEAIAVTPLTRREIVAGHWLITFAAAFAAGALTFVVAIGAFISRSSQGVSTSLPTGTWALVPVVGGFAATAAAVLVLAGILARTQAQMGFVMAPLMLLTVGGLGLLQATNPEPAAVMSALPFAGPGISMFTTLTGTAAPGAALIATVSSLAWTALALTLADRAFRSERALQRATS